MPINLFDVPKVINLVLPESTGSAGTIHMNYPVNKTTFTIVKGISQTIQFFVRDIDRQVIDFTGQTLTINIVDKNADILLLTRALVVVDTTQALFSLSLVSGDTRDWNLGPVSYSVMVTRVDGSQTLLWTDQNYGPYSYLTVVEGPVPGPVAPQTLDPSIFIITDGWASSSPLAGSVQTGYPNGAQTFSVYTTDFFGTIKILGTLLSQPSSDPTDWFSVAEQSIGSITTGYSGVTAITVSNNCVWTRILLPVNEAVLFQPVTPPVTSGSVDRVLYKN